MGLVPPAEGKFQSRQPVQWRPAPLLVQRRRTRFQRMQTAMTEQIEQQGRIDDTRVREIKELAPPSHLLREFSASERVLAMTVDTRRAIHSILQGDDDRLLVIVGPCSIHDPAAALEYATRLAAIRRELDDRLLLVMRVYFEKPRTTVGWKGLINDPRLDDSFRI